MNNIECEPGDPVPVPGPYEELDLLGQPTGKIFQFQADEFLPRQPRYRTWRLIAKLPIAAE